jgi:hypothetical protein
MMGVIVTVHIESSGGLSEASEDKHPVNKMQMQKIANNVDEGFRLIRIEYTEWF